MTNDFSLIMYCMNEKSLTKEEVLDLCERDESHFFDRKSKSIDGKKVQKIAVAFANADGGDILIGIKDDSDEPNPNLRWDGGHNKEEFNYIFQNLTEISPSINYEATFLFNPEVNTYALRVTVEKSSDVHHSSDSKVYIRVSAQSLLLKDPQKIQELSFAKGETSYEDQIMPNVATEEVFETDEMTRFLLDYSPKSDPVDFSVNQNLVDRRTYNPRVAGLLLFNTNPVVILPKKCAIKIIRYETADSEPKREHLKDQVTVEGPLYQQIHQTVKEVEKIMSNVNIWTATGLEKVKYPPETIWEIIVNAVIHRDYNISDDIHIYIYNNRIEVVSPGKFPGYVNEKNILEARYSRNPKIVRTLNRYKNPPNKDMGEGLNTAFQKMIEWRLKKPIIAVEGNAVKVTIPHTPLATPEESILEFLSKNETIKNRQARHVTNIESENKMKRVFYKMRDKGLLEPVYSQTGKKIIAWKRKKDLPD